jgi:hypothetical protein
MSARGIAMALGLVVASIGAAAGVGVAASSRAELPAATCTLPGTIPCTVDSECVAYDAICDTQANQCVCALGDLGGDLGSDLGDLGSRDLAGADLTAGSVSTGVPPVGGGMTTPPRSGCSFVPGQP